MKSATPRYYHLDVEIGPEKVDQVGRILAAHLRHWGLHFLVEPVCHCTQVLLRAVEEHGTDKETAIEMWWTGHHLITAVSDKDRDLPGLHYAPQGPLTQIAALSDGWGSCPAAVGKIIWFACRDRTPDHVPLTPVTPVPCVPESLEVPREESMAVLAGSPDT
ncbi:pep a2 [Streptomyces sp. NPDC046465]|uniref:pep a2 n=1 Tax=Streptomyces sp. NPDC046465 TaxID=3155810 RepID=UPI0033C42A33